MVITVFQINWLSQFFLKSAELNVILSPWNWCWEADKGALQYRLCKVLDQIHPKVISEGVQSCRVGSSKLLKMNWLMFAFQEFWPKFQLANFTKRLFPMAAYANRIAQWGSSYLWHQTHVLFTLVEIWEIRRWVITVMETSKVSSCISRRT